MNSQLETAIRAALKAGEIISDIYNDPSADFEIERKLDHSPLTVADRKSNEVILEYLKPTSYPIISEENKTIAYEERRLWQSLWMVDPLDGTKEFIKRNGEFTVNIAFIEKGRPTLGVIYIPVKHILYYGSCNGGAYKVENIGAVSDFDAERLENRALPLPRPRNTSSFVVVASRSHMNQETEDFIATLRRQHSDIRLTSIGSSVKICLVAEGTADIYPRFAPTMEWDTAAGHAIAIAAGKELYQTDGCTPLNYNKENLSNPWFIARDANKK